MPGLTAAEFAKKYARPTTSRFTAVNRALAAETPEQKALRNKYTIGLTYAGGGGFKSIQHDIAVDQAQRIAGLNPEDALRGPRFLHFGGKTFQSGAGDLYGTFTGDLEALKKQFASEATGTPGLMGSLDLSKLSKDEEKALREEFGTRSDVGSISMTRYLNRRLSQLTDEQREEVLGASGLTIDQFTQRFGTGQATSAFTGAGAEVEGFDPNAYQLGTHRLRESIGQAQASRGLYGSMASASAEAAAVASLQGAQRQATNPFLLSGTVDEFRGGVPGFFGTYKKGTGANELAAFGSGYYDANGQWVGQGTPGVNLGAHGAARYGMNNPLAFLSSASATRAAAFGAI